MVRARVLIAGWFSVDTDANTGGDLLALDTVARWLRERGADCTVAVSDTDKYTGVIAHRLVDAHRVTRDDADAVVFVCGPLVAGSVGELIGRFAGRPRLALGVSVVDEGSPRLFDQVVARDEPGATGRVDLSFGTRTTRVPVVGRIYVGPQPEYSDQREPVVRDVVARALAERGAATVEVDTRLPIASNPLRTPAQLESVLARLDLVVTTRLHGAVLALRNGVPAVVVDPVAGGSKLSSQMAAIGWPLTATVDGIDVAVVHALIDRALTEDLTGYLDDLVAGPIMDEARLGDYREALDACLGRITSPGR